MVVLGDVRRAPIPHQPFKFPFLNPLPLLSSPLTRPSPAVPSLAPCRVVVLEDGDLVHLQGGGYSVYNLAQMHDGSGTPDAASREVSRALQTLEMEVSQIMKVRGRGREVAGPGGRPARS